MLRRSPASREPPEFQRFFVENEAGRVIGEVGQRPDGRWSARLKREGRPFAAFARPAEADAAVRAALRFLDGRQGAAMR